MAAVAYYRTVENLAWLEEARWLEVVWDKADSATGPFGEDFRLSELDVLRKQVGMVAYYLGQLPPPIPVWRFRVR